MLDSILRQEWRKRKSKETKKEIDRISRLLKNSDSLIYKLQELQTSLSKQKRKLESELPRKYFIEEKVNGFRCLLHKKGDRVVLYSDQGKDITLPFPTIVRQAKQICKHDYILDGELCPYNEKGEPLGRNALAKYIGAVKSKKDISDKNIIYRVWDCLYFDKTCTMPLPEYERKKILFENIKDSENIKKLKFYEVSEPGEAREIVKKLSGLPGSEGAIIKHYDGIYMPGREYKSWIKFRIEIELRCISLGTLPVKNSNAVRHQLGIYITEREAKLIHPEYITEFNGKKVLKLGNSFNTLIKAKKGDILKVTVEEVWRHYKNHKYHYSLHKPNVREKMELAKPSTLKDLESAVVSRGVEIIESEYFEHTKKDEEGREIMIRDFPKRMQNNFKEIMEHNLYCPFVVQYHYRGHEISDDERQKFNIPLKYKYRLRSLHEDLRLWVPAGNVKYKDNETIKLNDPRIKKSYLEGLTILSPTTTDPNDPDDFIRGENARKGKIRVVTKLIESPAWLKAEYIADIDEPGSTPYAPGVFLIVAKGYYTIKEVSDHKIRIEFKCDKGSVNHKILEEADRRGILIERQPNKPPEKLKDLDGIWLFQIAHIDPKKWIILCRYMGNVNLNSEIIERIDTLHDKTVRNSKGPVKVTKEELYILYEMSKQGYFRTSIAKKLNIKERQIYNYQKLLGLI